jgi:hypothetical protein
LGNSITSIKEILRVNFASLFEETSEVEQILKKDPAKVYEKMDFKTKEYYRNKIKELSEETKNKEVNKANKSLDLAQKNYEELTDVVNESSNNKKSHIGYYLISEGINRLRDSLEDATNVRIKDSSRNSSPEQKAKNYIALNIITTTMLSMLFGMIMYILSRNTMVSIIAVFLIYIPISEICIQTINYILSKAISPKILPKLEVRSGIPEENATFVIIPTLIKSSKKVKELVHKLEVYYLANKSENIYFALLGDCSESGSKEEDFDEKMIETGIEEIRKLNEKYGAGEYNRTGNEKSNFPKFHFLYRKRKWNSSQKKFLGWERKRGLINEFNKLLLEKASDFRANTLKEEEIPDIKYVITLDADTELVLESAFELIGTISHILNKPVLDEEKNIVVEGHGIIQPRIGINLLYSRKKFIYKNLWRIRRNRCICKCSIRHIPR